MINSSQDSPKELPQNIFLVIDKHLLPVKQHTMNIGRHPNNDLIINDPRVSRWHAQIRFEDGDFILYDMDAKFGTFVNNERVNKYVLKTGDTISLANTPVLFIDRSDKIIRQIDGVTGVLLDEE